MRFQKIILHKKNRSGFRKSDKSERFFVFCVSLFCVLLGRLQLFHKKQVKISLSSVLQEEVVQIAGWKQFLKQKQPLQHGRDWPVSSWEACLLFGTILGLGDEVESQMQQCCTAEQREQFSRLPVDHTLFLIRDCCYQMLANCRRAKELVEQRSTD